MYRSTFREHFCLRYTSITLDHLYAGEYGPNGASLDARTQQRHQLVTLSHAVTQCGKDWEFA